MTKQLVLSFLEKKPDAFIVFCSDFPLSIVLVGVGDGPWDDLIHCNNNRRQFQEEDVLHKKCGNMINTQQVGRSEWNETRNLLDFNTEPADSKNPTTCQSI